MEAATAESNGQSPWSAHEASQAPGNPELPVLLALAGGFVLARILKAIGGGE
jgi:hypothetical protein